jgi:protein arginine kinase
VTDFLLAPPRWLSGGADRDVVVSVRARFVRNLEGEAFPWRAARDEVSAARDRIVQALSDAAGDAPVLLCDLEDCDALEGAALGERGLLGGTDGDQSGRAVAVLADGRETFAVNGIDHLRIVAWGAGSDLSRVFERARERELALDERLSFSFSPDFGYLASRPEDSGAALRLSALVFLPGIVAAGVFDRVSRSLLASGVEPRIRRLEGDGPPGLSASSFVELSARTPLGCSEEEAVQRFETVLRGVVDGERRTRAHVLERERAAIEDRTLRAAAVLRVARRLSSDELPRLLERLREGLVYGTVAPAKGASPTADPYEAVDAVRILSSPAHSRLYVRSRQLPSAADIDEARSALVREALPHYHIDGGL